MTTGQWDDDRVVVELAAALSEPDVPPTVLEVAKAVYTWRTVDAELAALAYDSASGEAFAGTRGSVGAPRSLTFRAAGVLIELEVTDDSLVGQVVPPERGVLEVHQGPGESVFVPVAATGSFCVHPRPRQAFRLTFRPARGGRVVTDEVTP